MRQDAGGKVVYNAGPGAGGDRQELAVVPGLGYLAPE